MTQNFGRSPNEILHAFRFLHDFAIHSCNELDSFTFSKHLRANQNRTQRSEFIKRLGKEELAPALFTELMQTTCEVIASCVAKNVGFRLFWREVAAFSRSDKDELALKSKLEA